MAASESHNSSLIRTAYIFSSLCLVLLLVSISQLCVSRATDKQLTMLHSRGIICLAALVMTAQRLGSIAHFASPTHAPYVIGFALLRALLLILLCFASTKAQLVIFDALFKSRLSKRAAPLRLRLVLKALCIVYCMIVSACTALAIRQARMFWFELYSVLSLLFIAAATPFSIAAVSVVIAKLKDIRGALSSESAQYNDIHTRTKQLYAPCALLCVFWAVIVSLSVLKAAGLRYTARETLFQTLMAPTDFILSLFLQCLFVVLYLAWAWTKCLCRRGEHAKRFTLFYLCCLAEDDGFDEATAVPAQSKLYFHLFLIVRLPNRFANQLCCVQ